MGKRTKGQDRDKYYHLAKDQGYRARSAFKLIEINKRYDFLSKAKVCIDLCAAPGGWCQVAAKTMPKGRQCCCQYIVRTAQKLNVHQHYSSCGFQAAVDLLPIRPIRNVKTLISDITTEECRSSIKKELQTWRADVVLCDGAPNVGTAYSKDAYVQNEQFFEGHQAVKPASSRSQSAEIFIVGTGYKAPDHIDPRMLDPKHVFDQGYEDGMTKGITVFHKKYDQHNKRHRTGYDNSLGPTLQKKGTVTAFVESEDPIQMMSDLHVIEFTEGCAVYKQHKQWRRAYVITAIYVKSLIILVHFVMSVCGQCSQRAYRMSHISSVDVQRYILT
eukprot:13844-Heterococcus_DN1.PRE.1